MPKTRHRQHEILEKQLTKGKVRMSTMFLSMEEELRNLAVILENEPTVGDFRIRQGVVAILRKTASFCGVHSFSHLKEDAYSLSADDLAALLLSRNMTEGIARRG